MTKNNNILNEEQLKEVAGGTGNIIPKFHEGDIYGLKILDDGSLKSYRYGVITKVAYDYKGEPRGYMFIEERKSSIDYDRQHVTITVIDYKNTMQIGAFDSRAKKFDKLPDPGTYELNSEYFF